MTYGAFLGLTRSVIVFYGSTSILLSVESLRQLAVEYDQIEAPIHAELVPGCGQ